MLKAADGGLHKLRMEREVNVRAVLAGLEETHKEVKIGFERSEQKERYGVPYKKE